MHRVPRLVCPWHNLGELRRSQFRVLGVALAVDNAEQCRLRGEMLALEGVSEDRCRDLDTCGRKREPCVVWTEAKVSG